MRLAGLSSNDFTSAEKAKLAGLESSHFKGLHVSLATLEIAHPTGSAGDYADVDPGCWERGAALHLGRARQPMAAAGFGSGAGA